MNLFELLHSIRPTTELPEPIPGFLYGAFRRKTISFFNGQTDEKTIVYWFQSRTFTIDLRLKNQKDTPVTERQGWIGNTLWDPSTQLLSWEVADYANYQNHVQWPEPARLHAIGNCILEFSPSNVYVEDWRQQVQQGLFLGLRLHSAKEVQSGALLQMDGGLIICENHIAYALTRLPEIQAEVTQLDFTCIEPEQHDLIESFEVSICTVGLHPTYTTRSHISGQRFDLNNFELVDHRHLLQRVQLDGQDIELIFAVDMYHPDYAFQHTTDTTVEAAHWLQTEQHHLLHHAERVL